MQSSLKPSCYRPSITLISIVIPNYWNGDFSMIAGFQSLYHTTKVLFSSFYNLKHTFYYFSATTYHKKHACNLKEYKKAKFCSFAAAQIGCQSKFNWLAFLKLCLL